MKVFKNGVPSKFVNLLLAYSVSATVSAQTIGNWNFNNTLAGTGGVYNTVSSASLSSSISSSGYYSNTMYYGADSWPTGTINTNMYIQFSLTPNPGYTLNIASIDLDMRRGSNNGQGPRNWSLRSSLDNFASDIASGSLSPNLGTETIPLGTSFTNLMNTLTFRIYGYNSNGGANRFAWNNIAVKGHIILSNNITSIGGKVGENNQSVLYWDGKHNDQLHYFEVERSDDGINFFVADKVYKQQTTNYTYSDQRSIAGSFVWYRIKSVELNGIISYSDIVKLQIKPNSKLTIDKIVANGAKITTQVNAPSNGTIIIMLTTIDGKIIAKQNYNISKGTQTLQVNRNNTPGVQILTVAMSNQLTSRQFVN